MPVWDIQQLQAVWWGLQPAPDIEALFLKNFSEIAPTIQKSPAGVVAQGTTSTKSVRMQLSGGRFDLFVAPGFGSDRMELLPFEPNLADFHKIARDLVEGSSAKRVAFLVTTARMTSSSAEASQLLANLLQFDLPFQPSSDFLVNINHRRKSAGVDIELNRLMKFQAEQFQTIISSGGPPTVTTEHAATLYVDINTVASPGLTITSAEVPVLFDEMFAEAKRLSEAQRLEALA